MSRHEIYQPELAQLTALPIIFGVSESYFEKRKKDGVFKEDMHFYIPEAEKQSKKHVVLWDINALRRWFRGNEVDAELQKLLTR